MLKLLCALIIAVGLMNAVLTYSCWEIQDKQARNLQFAVADAIDLIDGKLNFEHVEEN